MAQSVSPDSIFTYLRGILLGTSNVDNAGSKEQDFVVRDEIPVLIVGAGPTGLLSAALLSRLGSKLMAN